MPVAGHIPQLHELRVLAVVILATLALAGCSAGTPGTGLVDPTACAGTKCPEQVQAASIESPVGTPGSRIETPASGTTTSVPIGTPAHSPVASPEPTPSPYAFESAAAVLGPVVWATAIDPETRAPSAAVTMFDAGTRTLYATVKADRLTAGTAIGAQWTYNNTRLEIFDSTIDAGTADLAGSTWLEFHLSLAEPGSWPTGRYEVDILVNGELAVHGSVDVVSPGG